MMNTSGSQPMPFHRFEVESNGRTVDSNGRSSGRFSNATYNDRSHSQHGRSRSSKSGPKKKRRVKKRVLYILLGVIGIIAISVTVAVVMVLQKSGGSAPEAKVGTVDLEVTVQNMQFSEALADPESEDYRNFTLQFCQEMETFYRRSSIGDKYDGCLVKELRQGSIIVVFTLVFTSEYLPIKAAVRKVFTDNATPSNSGALEVTVGIYVITESSIVVGHVTVIANDKNPTPRISHGEPCKVDEACKTYQAVCINEKCGCGSSRQHSPLSDSCLLIPTTTTSTSIKPTAVQVTTPSTSASSTTTKPQTSESTTSSSHSTSISTTTSQQVTSHSTSSSPQSTTQYTSSSSQSTTPSQKTSSETTLSTSESVQLSSAETSTPTTLSTSVTTTLKHTSPTSAPVSVTSSTSSSTQSATSTPSTTNTPSSPSPTTASPTSTSSTATASPTTTTSTVTTTSSSTTSTSTTATSSTSSSTSDSTSTSTSTQPTATISTSTPSISTPTETTLSSSISTLSALTTEITTPSTHLTPQSSSIETSTPTQGSTTLPTLEVIPTANFISPQNRHLEIGMAGEIVYQVDNATDGIVVTITKTTSYSDTQQFIGEYTFQNGFTEGVATYGDNIDHIQIDLFGIDPSVSFNLMVRFDPVMCSDGGRYYCSVTVPAYSHGPIEVTEDVEANKMPVIQLNFPYELREGLRGLKIGCSATLGADETLSLMRKQLGETEFTEFMPPVQNPSELRRNEYIDEDFPCIKEATYDFDTDLEGWNMTEIRCAINADTVEAVLSDIGKFRIVPRSVCDGKEAGQKVPHPFNCTLFITCTTDPVTWGYVYRSGCPGYECWLPDGECGTTTTVIPTSPSTTTRTTTLPPHLPHITCSPAIRSTYTAGNVSYECAVHNVDVITQVNVVGNQIQYEQAGETGLSGTFTTHPVTLMVDVEAENQISITLASVACGMEGEVTITVNGNLSDKVILKILSDPQTPQLSTPENIYKNQVFTFTCSGNVGRVEDGSPAVSLGFEILLEGGTEPVSILGESVTVLSNTSENCENHVTIQFRNLAIDVMNGAILSCVSTATVDNSRLFKVSSKPVEVLEANIFFDKGLAYTVATGDILPLTCSFQNLPDVKQLKISRGENKEVVMILHKDGTSDQSLNHFTLSSSDWGDNFGSVTITANVTCEDKNRYTCEADNNSGEAVVLLDVRARPEKPSLSLSYELIEGQVPWPNRRSECKAQVGDPAGNLVVEILNGELFQELEVFYDTDDLGEDFQGRAVIYSTGYPQNTSIGCGIEQTIQFYFSDLVGLNNTEIRCAVKPAEVFNDTGKLVSEPQLIRTVEGSYCAGIDTSFHVHPYDCHYYVDCKRYGSADFYFNQCISPQNSCPNPSIGTCDLESCATLCNRGAPKPYLRCNGTIEAELNEAVTIRCELDNVDTISLEAVAVFQDDIVVFNETWESGTASLLDGSVTLTYTAEEIIVNIAQIQCHQDAVYTIIVNNLLSNTSTVIIKTNAMTPIISSTRFVADQLATITCDGIIGNPTESDQLFIEAWIMEGPFMTNYFDTMQPTSEVTEFNSSSCSYKKMVVLTIEVMAMMNGIIKFRCRTATDSGNLISLVINVHVDAQEIDIQPPESKVAVGDKLLIRCTVTGVTDLTLIRFYRGNATSQTVCQVTNDTIASEGSGIQCFGEVRPTGGSLVMNFTSVRCGDEDVYVCECNPQASTQKQTSLSISRPTQNPVFTSVPLTLVENITLLEAENFSCEADLGYPSTNILIIQSNRDGGYYTYDDVFGVKRTFLNDNCSVFETVTVKYYAFDSSWNDTQLRCALVDVNGTLTRYISEEVKIHLLPGTFCDGKEEWNLHPYDKHLYINCTETGLVVDTCNNECPTVTNGILTCGACSIT